MPDWYLIVSGAVALIVLGGVAYRALTDPRRRELPAGAGAEFDPLYADAPIRRETEEAQREPAARREELAQRGR